jgi:membrane protease YdiL (CAAX protease family)
LFVFLANWKYIEHNPLPLSPALVGIIAISAVPVAFVIASAYSRNPAVRNYLTSLVQLRGVWGWSLVALLLLPVLFLISVPVSSLVNNQLFPAAQFPELSLGLIGLILVKFLYQLFFFNATGEETGWRGFALPRIQEKTSPLIAAVITGFFWALWHFPMWQVDGRPVMAVGFWVEMFAGHILFSVPIVWMCNRSRGSILVAGIAHAAMNTVQAFAPFGNLLFPVISVAALVMILVDRMWVKLPSDHPAVSQAPISDSGDQPFALPVK